MIKHRLHRFKTQITQIIILSTIYCLLSTEIYAQPISSTELINNALDYDGKTVAYEGEAIGEVMVRGDFAWININDGKSAIGVWLNKASTRDILYTGSYKAQGDWVEVVGTFHRACLQHGGDLDIHAQALRKINPGRANQERVNPGKRNLALWLLGILCIALILRQLKLR